MGAKEIILADDHEVLVVAWVYDDGYTTVMVNDEYSFSVTPEQLESLAHEIRKVRDNETRKKDRQQDNL